MNLLEIITAASYEMGLTPPSVVVTSTDLQTQQMYHLVNRGLTELRKMNDWTVLSKTFVINSVPVISTTGDVTDSSGTITSIADSVSSVVAGEWAVSGAYLNQATRVATVPSSSSVTVNMVATGTAVGTDLVFSKDTFSLPTDFDHYIGDTWWDRTNHWMLLGPASPQIDEWHQSGIVAWGPRRTWRQVPPTPQALTAEAINKYRLWPPLGDEESGFSLAFEYVSSAPVYSVTDGGMLETFQNDDDEVVLDPQALILDLKWRFFQIKQLDAAPLQQEYLDYVNRLIGRDGSAKTLNMSKPSDGRFLISPSNIQDGNWPGGS